MSWYLGGGAPAADMLRRADFVGLQEGFGTSVCLLYWRLGLRSDFFKECPSGGVSERINAGWSTRGPSVLPSDYRAVLRGVLSRDVQLYGQARLLFLRRVGEVERSTGVTFEEARRMGSIADEA